MNRGKFFGLIGLLTIFSLMVIFTSNLNPFESVIEVNGNSTESITYYLGDRMYSEGGNYFYFHGITHPSYQNMDELLIAHSVGGGGSSNIHIGIMNGDIFRIKSQSFKILNYGKSWITLEMV